MDVCESLLFLRIIRLLNTGIRVIRIVVPIGLIVKLFIDGYHDMMNNEGKRIKELGIKRVMAALIVFLAPIFVNIVLKLVEAGSGNKFEYPYCLSGFENVEYYEKLAVIKQEIEDDKKRNEEEARYAAKRKAMQEAIEEAAKKIIINDEAALYLGQRYKLTNQELRGLCGVAKAEQGSVEGAKAEASLMANLYELRISSNGSGSGLYNYVRNGGWFAHAAEHMEEGCPNDYLNAVRDVLVNGNRTLPFYIDEHDCFGCTNSLCAGGVKGDICKLNTNGVIYSNLNEIKNRNNYIRDNTKVYTRYTKNNYWVFYSFPAPRSDPFGYTEAAKRRVEGMNR